MARKKSIRLAATSFVKTADDLEEFVKRSIVDLSKREQSWCYDYAIIALYRAFEDLMLSVIVGAINNDSSTISQSTGVTFPKHLTDEVCEYLVVGGGYFDFKGRPGLIKLIKRYVPSTHYLVGTIKKEKYKDTLDQLSALRNFAAHGGPVAKRAALVATGQHRLDTSGSWLKVNKRYLKISGSLKALALEIRASAPY